MKRAGQTLVTGGAGFIGSHLVERLLAEGKSVGVIDDLSTGSAKNLANVRSHPRLRWVQASVSRCVELAEWVGEAETVYHLAATVGVDRVLESPLRAIQTNLDETEAVLQAASQHGAKVVLTSSSEVYGKSERELLREDADLNIGPPTVARWSYACSKLMAEFLALSYARERNLPVIIARLFNTVGPRQSGRYGMVLPRFLAAARSGQPLRVFGDGKQTRCFCDVADTVEALLRLERCPEAPGQIVNVGGVVEISMLELAQLITRTLRSTSTIEFVPYEEAYTAGFEDFPRRRPDLTKLKRLTGFLPAAELGELIERLGASFSSHCSSQ
ncbi:MAG TPA: NAD-dependent epimerase/dehydratase family protein [Verrucomicrobiae bacterium]|nr:NAD-dependent epimerase/dehydratase family protein [Verrucomicrobiae bacterium]